MGLIYILICAPTYKSKCAYLCLEELQRQFTHAVGERATTAKTESLSPFCRNMMTVLCKKYNNLENVDKLSDIARKVDNVKAVMQDNIDISLQNCVKLESIERQAEELQLQANVFKKDANKLKNKMRCKEIRLKIIIGVIVLAVLGGIIGFIVYKTKNNSSSPAPA
jgi:hypothetical protein